MKPLHAFFALLALVRHSCGWSCISNLKLKPVVSPERKGFAVDDLSFFNCPDKLLDVWPGTRDKVTSLRLFRAWDPTRTSNETRERVWGEVVKHVHRTGSKVLVGTQITCDPVGDAEDWEFVKNVLSRLGPQRVLGLAVGNEVDLLHKIPWLQAHPDIRDHCFRGMWSDYYPKAMLTRVKEMDRLPGFEGGEVPVTAAFIDSGIHHSHSYEFLKKMHHALGSRLVFTYNVYPYFDSTLSAHDCNDAINRAVCFVPGCKTCTTFHILRDLRAQVKGITSRDDSKLWIGEMGWSSPMANTLETQMRRCKGFSSMNNFRAIYEGFLGWNLSEDTAGVRPPDHIFYFTMRDSMQDGQREHMGLMGRCASEYCKLQDEYPPRRQHCPKPMPRVHHHPHEQMLSLDEASRAQPSFYLAIVCAVCCCSALVMVVALVRIKTWAHVKVAREPAVVCRDGSEQATDHRQSSSQREPLLNAMGSHQTFP